MRDVRAPMLVGVEVPRNSSDAHFVAVAVRVQKVVSCGKRSAGGSGRQRPQSTPDEQLNQANSIIYTTFDLEQQHQQFVYFQKSLC
jgi:hypothetical protein